MGAQDSYLVARDSYLVVAGIRLTLQEIRKRRRLGLIQQPRAYNAVNRRLSACPNYYYVSFEQSYTDSTRTV